MILCRSFEVWKKSLNTRRNEPNKMAEAIGSQQRKHKLAKLSVFSVVRKSSFHRHSEGGNNNKKQSKTNGKLISNCNNYFYYCLFMRGSLSGVHWGGSVDQSIQWSVDQVHMGLHGLGVSVFGSPLL